MTTQTAREYLVPLGLAKAGRGKFSAAAHDELQAALGRGVKFSDYPKTDTVVKTSKGKTETVKAAPKPGAGPTPDPVWPLGTRVYASQNGKRVEGSMTAVCNNCRVSLWYCVCHLLGRDPVALVSSIPRSAKCEIVAPR